MADRAELDGQLASRADRLAFWAAMLGRTIAHRTFGEGTVESVSSAVIIQFASAKSRQSVEFLIDWIVFPLALPAEHPAAEAVRKRRLHRALEARWADWEIDVAAALVPLSEVEQLLDGLSTTTTLDKAIAKQCQAVGFARIGGGSARQGARWTLCRF